MDLASHRLRRYRNGKSHRFCYDSDDEDPFHTMKTKEFHSIMEDLNALRSKAILEGDNIAAQYYSGELAMLDERFAWHRRNNIAWLINYRVYECTKVDVTNNNEV